MSQFFNSISEVRKNYKGYDSWEQKQADERAKKEYLSKNLNIPQDKLDLINKRAETVIRATEVMDARSEDNCQNMEQLTGILSVIPVVGIQMTQVPITNKINNKHLEAQNAEIAEASERYRLHELNEEAYNKKIDNIRKIYNKKIARNAGYVAAGTVIAALLATVAMILWGNSKQKEASRIGRYQAKQNELKGVENFVVYTPEQIEKAKEIAKSIPDEKDRNSISKMISELKGISRDKEAYKKWLSEKDPKEIEKLKALNLTPEQVQKGEEDKELIVDTVKEINIKAEEYSENVENSFDTLKMTSWLFAVPLGLGLNKIMKLLKTGKTAKNIVSLSVPIITPLIISLIGTLEEKKASRVGRYMARKDLMSNPSRLLAFSDDDMKKAENVSAPKQKQGFFQKLGDSFAFLGKYFKDKSEYNKYKKTTQKENEKLQKALKELEITEEQKKDAKALQKNVFRAFDEVDEMSQRYSEDVEAGCEIAKEIGNTTYVLGTMAATVLLTDAVLRGKFPLTKLVNKLTNMTFAPQSPIKKSINNFNNVLQAQDKTKIYEFQKAFVQRKLDKFFEKSENSTIKEAYSKIVDEFAKLNLKGAISNVVLSSQKKDVANVFNELFKNHFKQTMLAKWTRNMISQSSKLWFKYKANKADAEIPKIVQEQLHMNFNYKNYKTLINTGIVGSVPNLGVIFGIPYAYNAWLTNIQNKGGKIGIMKAMDKIDDSRVFAPEEQIKSDVKSDNNNLLSRINR